MSDPNVIQEFLSVLGFKVDDASFKKFESRLGDAAKAATKMTAVVEAAATAVDFFVVKMAGSLDQLYWASQRTGASAQNISAIAYAVGQLGGTAAGAKTSLEAVGFFLRSNPGAASWLGALGVRTRDANGQLRDTAEIMGDLGARFRAMPQYRAIRYAQMLGIDYNTLLALERGTGGYSSQYKDFAKNLGVSLNEGVGPANKFMTSVRELRMEFGLLTAKIGLDLITRWGPQLRSFMLWTSAHALEIAQRVEVWTVRIAKLGSVIFNFALKAIDLFDRLDKATGGWSSALVGVLLAWRALNLGFMLTPIGAIVTAIMALIAALVLLFTDMETWRTGGRSLIDWSPWAKQVSAILSDTGELNDALRKLANTLRVDLGPSASSGFKVLLEWIDHLLQELTHLGRAMDAALHGRWAEAGREAMAGVMSSPLVAAAGAVGAAAGGSGGKASTPRVAGKFGAVQAMFESLGWSPEQAAGIVANLQRESGLDPSRPNATGNGMYGLAQWDTKRRANFRKLFGHDIHNSTMAEQVAFVNHELRHGTEQFAGRKLMQAKTAGEAGAAVALYYERFGNHPDEVAARARLAETGAGARHLGAVHHREQHVAISHKTDIHVHGVGSPNAVATMLAGIHDRTWADTLRNAKGALR